MSKCNKIKQNLNVAKFKKTKIVTKLISLNWDKAHKLNLSKNSNSGKTQKLKL